MKKNFTKKVNINNMFIIIFIHNINFTSQDIHLLTNKKRFINRVKDFFESDFCKEHYAEYYQSWRKITQSLYSNKNIKLFFSLLENDYLFAKKHIASHIFFTALQENTRIKNVHCVKPLFPCSHLYYIQNSSIFSPFDLLPTVEFSFSAKRDKIKINLNCKHQYMEDHKSTFQLFKKNNININIYQYLTKIIIQHSHVFNEENYQKHIKDYCFYFLTRLLKTCLIDINNKLPKEKHISGFLSLRKSNIDNLLKDLPVFEINIPDINFYDTIDFSVTELINNKSPYKNDHLYCFNHFYNFCRDNMNIKLNPDLVKSMVEYYHLRSEVIIVEEIKKQKRL